MPALVTVAVIGAGALGRRLALLSARAGYATVLEDVLPSALRKAEAELQHKTGGEGEAGVRFSGTIEDAVRSANLIIDCVPDELESKLEIFSLLDRMAPPRAILCTPTQTQSIADLASCTYRGERCVAFEVPAAFLGTGPLPPSTSVTLVYTRETAAEVREAVEEFWARLGLSVTHRLDAAELRAST